MKVIILAGGKGTRISEESKWCPKPMVKIGEKPILWHIMKQYSAYGFCEFVICCGYKGYMIKEYFVHYYKHTINMDIDLGQEKGYVFERTAEPWKVTLVDTGLETLTAGRILRARDYIGSEPFMLTYGDGVSNVNIMQLLKFHEKQGKIATITVTQPEGRFGAIRLDEEKRQVQGFREKARTDQPFVNSGFMVFQPEVFRYLSDGNSMLETLPFEGLIKAKQMAAYHHTGFWSPMDTVHDRDYLEQLWCSGKAPWRIGT
ncbi:glucose-1-phosphate cytidylyltransferase [Lachnospiraceae bacterium ZAX-1]